MKPKIESIFGVPELGTTQYWNILNANERIAGCIICVITGKTSQKAVCSVILHGDPTLTAKNIATVHNAHQWGYKMAAHIGILNCLIQAGKIDRAELADPDINYQKWFTENGYTLNKAI